MTKSLIKNRYNDVTPTLITENGTAISCPQYYNPTADKKKELLNAFRTIKTQQLIEQGYNAPEQSGSLVVVTNKQPKLAPIEQEMGINEDALRSVLFSRQGISDRIIMKLSQLTGIPVLTREEVELAQKLWNDEIFGTKKPRKAANKTKKATVDEPTTA